MPAPFDEHRAVVRPEWIDHNGHMNAGYYMVVFDDAVTPWSHFIGFTPEHRDVNRVTTFSAEGHITYDREVLEGATLRVTTQLLGYDAKRIHSINLMYQDDDGYLAATNELMTLHVSTADRRVAADRARHPRPAGAHLGRPPPPRRPGPRRQADHNPRLDGRLERTVPAHVGRQITIPGWTAG